MRSLSLLGVALLTLLASACATGPASQQPSGPAAYAAYLTYPDRLQPVPGDDGAYRWIDPSAKLAQYNRILLDPIQVQLASDADYKAIDPAQLQTLTDYFRQSIAKAEAGDLLEIIETSDFTGSVAGQRQSEIVRSDAGAVISNPNQPNPGLFHFNHNTTRAGIQAVFQQLLNYRSRALDDFTGSDLADQLRRQELDAGGQERGNNVGLTH